MRVLLTIAALAAAQDSPNEPIGDYKELLDRVALLEERLRLTNIPEVTDDENDERSLLEQFTDAAGDFIVNRLLPRSDAQCRWNYAKSVCVPRCECSFQHRAGDLTPSRACRLRPPDSFLQEEVCDPDVSGERGTFEKVAGLIAVRSERAFDQLLGFLRDAAPDTSPDCDWSWSSKKCEPVDRCHLRYRFGDFHLGRSCRLRPPPVPIDDGFGELDEESIRDNFVIIYELMDETMDFGYPQISEAKILREYITQEAHKLEVVKPPMAVTNAVSWRSEGIKHRKNEIFLDVVERLNLLVAANGTLLRSAQLAVGEELRHAQLGLVLVDEVVLRLEGSALLQELELS